MFIRLFVRWIIPNQLSYGSSDFDNILWSYRLLFGECYRHSPITVMWKFVFKVGFVFYSIYVVKVKGTSLVKFMSIGGAEVDYYQ